MSLWLISRWTLVDGNNLVSLRKLLQTCQLINVSLTPGRFRFSAAANGLFWMVYHIVKKGAEIWWNIFLLYNEACKLKIVTKAGLLFLKNSLAKFCKRIYFFSDALLMEMIVIEKMFNYSCIFFIWDFAEKFLSFFVIQDISTVSIDVFFISTLFKCLFWLHYFWFFMSLEIGVTHLNKPCFIVIHWNHGRALKHFLVCLLLFNKHWK